MNFLLNGYSLGLISIIILCLETTLSLAVVLPRPTRSRASLPPRHADSAATTTTATTTHPTDGSNGHANAVPGVFDQELIVSLSITPTSIPAFARISTTGRHGEETPHFTSTIQTFSEPISLSRNGLIGHGLIQPSLSNVHTRTGTRTFASTPTLTSAFFEKLEIKPSSTLSSTSKIGLINHEFLESLSAQTPHLRMRTRTREAAPTPTPTKATPFFRDVEAGTSTTSHFRGILDFDILEALHSSTPATSTSTATKNSPPFRNVEAIKGPSLSLTITPTSLRTFAKILPSHSENDKILGIVTPSSTRPSKTSSVLDFEALVGNSTAASASSPTQSNDQNNGSAPGTINVQVWAPLVGIVAVIALLVIYTCFRKNSMNASMIAATRSANDAAAGTSSTASGGRRRPRRTPSQISTRSLPAYMMDPGDQEIVLARGGLRRNRSRPEMGLEDDEYEDDMDMEDNDDTDMYEPNGRISQADRPLLASSATTSPTDSRLAPPARYNNNHSRASTSFDTVRVGSEDSHHLLLQDTDDIVDADDPGEGQGGGTLYVFGEGTTGGQLYDENERDEEHVEMSELRGGVSVGSTSELDLTSSTSASASDGRGRMRTQQQQLHSPPSSPISPGHRIPKNIRTPGARAGAGPTGGFFSSFSSLLSNSFSSIANSLSGMNAPMAGSTIGVGVGSAGGALSSANVESRSRSMSPARNTTTAADASRRQNANGTVRNTNADATSRSAFLTPPHLPPPYEGSSRASQETETGTERTPSHSRSQSSPGNTNPSSSTLSLSSHFRNLSSSNLNASNVVGGSSSSLTISAPLAHTVKKSTFTYPSSGPTTEQIKFLSSREALVRFGVPYGDEAVAAAAKAAARDGSVEGPPPRFEDIAETGSRTGTGTRTRASTSASAINPSLDSPSSSSIKSPGSASYSYGDSTSTTTTTPTRSDSRASRTSSIRSNRSVVSGPRGPRNSIRKSTLSSVDTGVEVERERTPRPSMDSLDSLDSVDSFGIVVSRRRGTTDDTAYRDTVESKSEPPPRTQQRQPSLPTSLPKLTIEPAISSSIKPSKQILPTTAPRGFVMSSPPPSPTPTTSTNPHPNYKHYSYGGRLHHANSNSELGVPVITFAPATPSGEGDPMEY